MLIHVIQQPSIMDNQGLNVYNLWGVFRLMEWSEGQGESGTLAGRVWSRSDSRIEILKSNFRDTRGGVNPGVGDDRKSNMGLRKPKLRMDRFVWLRMNMN